MKSQNHSRTDAASALWDMLSAWPRGRMLRCVLTVLLLHFVGNRPAASAVFAMTGWGKEAKGRDQLGRGNTDDDGDGDGDGGRVWSGLASRVDRVVVARLVEFCCEGTRPAAAGKTHKVSSPPAWQSSLRLVGAIQKMDCSDVG